MGGQGQCETGHAVSLEQMFVAKGLCELARESGSEMHACSGTGQSCPGSKKCESGQARPTTHLRTIWLVSPSRPPLASPISRMGRMAYVYVCVHTVMWQVM